MSNKYQEIEIKPTRQKALYRCGKGLQNPLDFKKCDITLLTLLTYKDRPRDAPASKKESKLMIVFLESTHTEMEV